MSVGDLKYKIFLFSPIKIKKIASNEIKGSKQLKELLFFLLFFEALTALNSFAI